MEKMVRQLPVILKATPVPAEEVEVPGETVRRSGKP